MMIFTVAVTSDQTPDILTVETSLDKIHHTNILSQLMIVQPSQIEAVKTPLIASKSIALGLIEI